MPKIARLVLVNYGIRNKQAVPRSTFIAMTRFYDLKLSLKTKQQVAYRYNETFAYLKNIRDPR